MSDEVREELAVGRHRRPATYVAAALILGMSALGTMCLAVPTPPAESSSNLAPPPPTAPTAIGGGPPVGAVEEPAGGVVCQTIDGAPYEAHRCRSEEPGTARVTSAR